jgi:hypothetical protein
MNHSYGFRADWQSSNAVLSASAFEQVMVHDEYFNGLPWRPYRRDCFLGPSAPFRDGWVRAFSPAH